MVDGKSFKAHLDQDHGSHKNTEGFEPYQYLANETPMKIPRPSEVGMKLAPKKSNVPKLGANVQTAFAAQNLEDLAMYDVDKEDISKDIDNVSRAIEEFYNTPIEKRLENSNKARKALDQFRPEKAREERRKKMEVN